MNKEVAPTPRPTFKKNVATNQHDKRHYSDDVYMVAAVFASVKALKQYAQKSLELTGIPQATALEASLVFSDAVAANGNAGDPRQAGAVRRGGSAQRASANGLLVVAEPGG